MVLRAGQRRQTEEFEKVDGQFILDDRDTASDRLWRVRRKAQDIPRDRQDALLLPSEQRYSVILFWRFFAAARLSGLMFSSPVTPARFAFFHEVGDLAAKRVDLNH